MKHTATPYNLQTRKLARILYPRTRWNPATILMAFAHFWFSPDASLCVYTTQWSEGKESYCNHVARCEGKKYFFWMSFIFFSIITFQPDSFLFHTHTPHDLCRSVITLWWNGMPWNSILKTTLLEQQQNRVWSEVERRRKNVRCEACLSRFRNEVKWKNSRVTVWVYVRRRVLRQKAFTTLSNPRCS